MSVTEAVNSLLVNYPYCFCYNDSVLVVPTDSYVLNEKVSIASKIIGIALKIPHIVIIVSSKCFVRSFHMDIDFPLSDALIIV